MGFGFLALGWGDKGEMGLFDLGDDLGEFLLCEGIDGFGDSLVVAVCG